MSGRSLRASVNAKCRSSIYEPGSGNGTWRKQVEACSSSNCPLHPFRPISGAKTGKRGSGATSARPAPASALHGAKNGLPAVSVGLAEGGAP
jgi:hypothetical protein